MASCRGRRPPEDTTSTSTPSTPWRSWIRPTWSNKDASGSKSTRKSTSLPGAWSPRATSQRRVRCGRGDVERHRGSRHALHAEPEASSCWSRPERTCPGRLGRPDSSERWASRAPPVLTGSRPPTRRSGAAVPASPPAAGDAEATRCGDPTTPALQSRALRSSAVVGLGRGHMAQADGSRRSNAVRFPSSLPALHCPHQH